MYLKKDLKQNLKTLSLRPTYHIGSHARNRHYMYMKNDFKKDINFQMRGAYITSVLRPRTDIIYVSEI